MKKIFPILLSSVLLFFYVVTIQASPEDSLRNVISNTEGEEKIKALANLTNIKIQGEDGLEYATMLEEEARKQNNVLYIGKALAIKATIYASQSNSEKFFPVAEEAMAYLLEKKDMYMYFLLYNAVIKVHLNDGNYETAFLKISLMLEDAKKFNDILGEIHVYENMGDAYFVERYFQKSLDSYRTAFSLMSAHKEHTLLRAWIGVKVAHNAYQTGDMSLTILYCDSVRQLVEEYDQSKTVLNGSLSSNFIKNGLFANLALAYISVGREEVATDAMNMALKYAEEDLTEDYQRVFYFHCSDYYFKKGEYETALEYIVKNEELTATIAKPDSEDLLMKSKILAAMGNFEDSFDVNMEYIELTDSLNRKKIAQRVSELHTIHQVEKLEFKAEQERLKAVNMRQFVVGLLVVVLLLACVISIVIYHLNKTRQKNRVLFQRIQSQEAVELELKRKEEALHSKSSFDGIISDEDAGRLYLRLKELMKDKKNYTDPNITRKTIAIKLGTNETYLYDTIKKCLDMSYTEYVNLLRLDYAKEMMKKYLNKLALEDIAMMSGFGTRQTFHRLFRDRYGLSPFEYSKMLKNN
jgi:AraC-type DNA-binding domain-containing proteins